MNKSYRVKLEDVVSFGKFKGNTWKDIFYTVNASYLNWCRLNVGVVFPEEQNKMLDIWMRDIKRHQESIKFRKGVYSIKGGFSTGDPQVDYDLQLCGQD
jgi:hypothetical protein